MPLDIPALPSANQVLRYAKASYDFDRDGGDVALHSIPSQQVPASSVIVGISRIVTTPFAADPAATVNLMVATQEVLPGDTDSGIVSAGWLTSSIAYAPVDGSFPITVQIAGNPLTAGAMTIYLWYIL